MVRDGSQSTRGRDGSQSTRVGGACRRCCPLLRDLGPNILGHDRELVAHLDREGGVELSELLEELQARLEGHLSGWRHQHFLVGALSVFGTSALVANVSQRRNSKSVALTMSKTCPTVSRWVLPKLGCTLWLVNRSPARNLPRPGIRVRTASRTRGSLGICIGGGESAGGEWQSKGGAEELREGGYKELREGGWKESSSALGLVPPASHEII